MKKLTFLALMLAALLALTACAAAPGASEMQLKNAELSAQEESILSLLGNSKAAIYDFAVSDDVRAVHVERYELDASGVWQSIGGGSFAIGQSGRIALSMDPAGDMIRFAVQDSHGTSALKQAYPTNAFTGMAVSTFIASSPVDIQPDQEIPLIVQIISSKSKVTAYDVEYFFHPEEYVKQGHEHVYAITATFSQDSLS